MRATSSQEVVDVIMVVEELVDVEAARAMSVPVLRRFTGGGTVVVDQSTVFSTFIVSVGR